MVRKSVEIFTTNNIIRKAAIDMVYYKKPKNLSPLY